MGLKEAWANECKKAFDARDWNKLWKIMYAATLAGATGGPFAVAPNASFFLRRFLEKGGDIKLDYTSAFPGQSNWLYSPSMRNGIAKLDTDARAKCLTAVKSGKENGIYNNKVDVIQGADADGDCYYAIGKFILKGEYKFSIIDWFGKRQLKIERVYTIKEPYDWTPGATGGILPHDYPIALQNNGLAAVYTYEIIFGEPEYKIPFK
jgi:hypothetical protein